MQSNCMRLVSAERRLWGCITCNYIHYACVTIRRSCDCIDELLTPTQLTVAFDALYIRDAWSVEWSEPYMEQVNGASVCRVMQYSSYEIGCRNGFDRHRFALTYRQVGWCSLPAYTKERLSRHPQRSKSKMDHYNCSAKLKSPLSNFTKKIN